MSGGKHLARVVYDDVAQWLERRADNLSRNHERMAPRTEVEILRELAKLCREKMTDEAHIGHLASKLPAAQAPVQN